MGYRRVWLDPNASPMKNHPAEVKTCVVRDCGNQFTGIGFTCGPACRRKLLMHTGHEETAAGIEVSAAEALGNV